MKSPWLKLSYALLLDSRISCTDAVVYAVLVDKSVGGAVSMPVKKLSVLTGLSISTLKRCIASLHSAGYVISVERRQYETVITLSDAKERASRCVLDADAVKASQIVAISSRLRSVGSHDDPEAVYEALLSSAILHVGSDPCKYAPYLAKMIVNYQPLEKPDNSDGFDASEYECFLNDFS